MPKKKPTIETTIENLQEYISKSKKLRDRMYQTAGITGGSYHE
jgi:hypothetical protein